MKKSFARILVFLIAAALPMGAHAIKLNFDLDKAKNTLDKVKALMPSDDDEVAMGKDAAAKLLGGAPLVDDAALQAYVNRLGKWIAMHSDRPNLPWRFGVLDDKDVNAFSMMGGIVLITRGMLMHMRDESELAGVLAHEITHITEKHALQTLRKDMGAEAFGKVLSREVKKHGHESYSKVTNGMTEIWVRGFDKDDEYAADRGGVVLAARAGYDPYGLASMLQTLASINPQDGAVALMFKTHPDSGERLKRVTDSMDGRLDKYADEPRAADRFTSVIQTHVAHYKAHAK